MYRVVVEWEAIWKKGLYEKGERATSVLANVKNAYEKIECKWYIVAMVGLYIRLRHLFLLLLSK